MNREWNDDRVEMIMGTLLRAGVLLAAAVVITGAALFLFHHGAEQPHYAIFRGEPSDLRTVRGVVSDVRAGTGRGVIQLGLLLLIATPVARVLFSVVAFVLERDRAYVLITLVVLSVLIFSMAGGSL